MAVKDCFNFEGDAIGDCPFFPGEGFGGVEGLPTTAVGEDGEEGRRNGEARGELKGRGDWLYAEACLSHQLQVEVSCT